MRLVDLAVGGFGLVAFGLAAFQGATLLRLHARHGRRIRKLPIVANQINAFRG